MNMFYAKVMRTWFKKVMFYEVNGKKGERRPRTNQRSAAEKDMCIVGLKRQNPKDLKNGEKRLGTQSANPCGSWENCRKLRKRR